jgi:hypothetical protein
LAFLAVLLIILIPTLFALFEWLKPRIHSPAQA